MELEKLFRDAVRELRARGVAFAVAGGFAAGLYRPEPRVTMDIDLGIITETPGPEDAVAVVEALGLRAAIARRADLAGGPLFAIRRRNTAPCMVVGRHPSDKSSGMGVDIILPAVPWVQDAVRRAQDNLVDFGFDRVPVLTLEDVVVSKLYALGSARLRAKDLDDLQSIAATRPQMDTAYVAGQISRLAIAIPREARPFLPECLLKLAAPSRAGRVRR